MQSVHTEQVASASQLSYWRTALKPHQLYGWSVTFCGLALMLWGVREVAFSSNILNFIILLILVGMGSIPATSSALAKITSFTFSISSVVAIASIPSLGVGAAIVLASSAHFVLWWFKPHDPLAWKKTWAQLGFNAAMDGLAMAAAGLLYIPVLNIVGYGPLQMTLIWFLAVALFVFANLSILYMMIRLQHGAEMTVRTFISNVGWSIGLGFVVHAVGGGFLAYAIGQYDTQGIFIFFLPIFLSAYAFQLYAREMQEHMDNLEDIIAERTQELAQLNSEKDAFLAVLTHDMRSPLNTIKLTMEMIQRKPAMVAERPHITERILRAQNILLQLVSDIVDLGKMEAGKPMELKRSTIDLIKLTKDIVDEQISTAQTKSIQLTLSEAPAPVEVPADHYQMQRVLTNLITNAIKYTPNGGQVDVSVSRKEESVEIMIKDSGYGIPEADLPTIFEPYQRVSGSADKARGTGLGLSITKAITEAHGGSIIVESKEGVGSTFRIVLPASTS